MSFLDCDCSIFFNSSKKDIIFFCFLIDTFILLSCIEYFNAHIISWKIESSNSRLLIIFLNGSARDHRGYNLVSNFNKYSFEDIKI